MKEVPANFSQIGSKVFDGMIQSGDVVFSTDHYLPDSVKSLERKCRGCGDKLILKGAATKRPSEWKLFLSNDDNKVQFIRLLLKLWSGDEYAAKLQGRQVILICEGSCLLTHISGWHYYNKRGTSSTGIITRRDRLQGYYVSQLC